MLAIGQAICHEANQMVNSTIASLTQQIAKDVLRSVGRDEVPPPLLGNDTDL